MVRGASNFIGQEDYLNVNHVHLNSFEFAYVHVDTDAFRSYLQAFENELNLLEFNARNFYISPFM